MRTLLLDDCQESLLKDTQPMSICDVNLIVESAVDAGFFDQPDILEPCSFNSPEDWYGIRDHVGRSKWIKVPTGVSKAPILMVLLDLLWTHVPECLNKIFSRFDDEDDFDDAEEAGDEPENRLTLDT